ncbi:MAG: hypothetical protein PWQ67_2302 [Clostridia bacterium]|nr:hypothetical protein [Clostridia bacterium]MDN5323848.1 hypothetical protein [Clostridia bacterium]
MSRNKIIAMLLIFVLVLVLGLGFGCTPQKRPAPAPRDNDRGVGETRMDERDDRRDTEATEKAERLAEMIAERNPSVNAATVVFAEEIVYVGIDLKANLSGNEAEKVKKDIAKMVKQEDPDIETVYVTEDADTYTRLQKIARDIERGRPVSGFLEELQNMFKRVTPSMD